MLCAAIYDACQRSELERDPESKRRGHSTTSYAAALEQGLRPIHPQAMTSQPDAASIRKAMAWSKSNRRSARRILTPSNTCGGHLQRAVGVKPPFDQPPGPQAQHDAWVGVLPPAWAEISDQTLGSHEGSGVFGPRTGGGRGIERLRVA